MTENCHILIVDDNKDAADTLHMLLEVHGYKKVRTAYSHVQVYDILDRGYVPNVTLIDIGLPEVNGYDLAADLKHRCPECKFVAISGHGQKEYHERSEAAGFKYHLLKPVDPVQLEHIVREQCAAAGCVV